MDGGERGEEEKTMRIRGGGENVEEREEDEKKKEKEKRLKGQKV